jgi:hypothetical protein
LPEPLKLRPDDLTIGDMEDFEKITGEPFMATLARLEESSGVAALSAKTLKALVFIVKRTTDPDFRIEDTRKVKVGELILDYSDEPDPTEAAS